MRSLKFVFAVVTAAILGRPCSSQSLTGNKIAVILDAGTAQSDYSQFFSALKQRGFDLKYTTPKDDFHFFELEERAYDHAILFPQKSKGLGPNLSPQELAKFVSAGGNLLIGASSTSASSVRDFAKELDVELAERDTLVADHFNFDGSSDDRHTTILASKFTEVESILSKEVQDGAPIVYKGIGHSLGNGQLISPILGASRTSYSYDIKEEFDAVEDPWVSGSQTWLVSAIQARNNARIGITGSVEMFSNAAFTTELEDGKIAGNERFARDFSKWLFQERGVLRAFDLRHSLANQSASDILPTMYRVKNEVSFGVSLQWYADGQWTPYVADDVQLELIMLDPYIRTTLVVSSTTSDAARYSATFMLPDHYGVFHFKVNYKRNGLSYVEERSQVTIRHYRHDEYDRFLVAAYPYYTATGTTIIGFLCFCFIWLFNQPAKTAGLKKTQ